jgi:hypothetical protein
MTTVPSQTTAGSIPDLNYKMSLITFCRILYFPITTILTCPSDVTAGTVRLITMLVTSMLQLFDYNVSTATFSWQSALRERSICAGGSGRNGLAQATMILVCTYVRTCEASVRN